MEHAQVKLNCHMLGVLGIKVRVTYFSLTCSPASEIKPPLDNLVFLPVLF